MDLLLFLPLDSSIRARLSLVRLYSHPVQTAAVAEAGSLWDKGNEGGK